MHLNDLIELFLASRKQGILGATRQCSERTIEVYRGNLKAFAEYLLAEEKTPVTNYEDINRLTISRFVSWLEARESSGAWSKATRLQILRTLRALFKFIEADDDLEKMGLRSWRKYLGRIPKTPRRTDIPQVKDVKQFLRAWDTNRLTDYRDYVATMLMIDTGLRIGEVVNIELQNVRLEERQIFVLGKKREIRAVGITAGLVPILKSWLKHRLKFKTAGGSPYLFVSKYRPQMSLSAWEQAFARVKKRHGLTGRVTPHALRHAFATNYLRKGGSMEQLRIRLGHAQYDMCLYYLDLARQGSKEMQQEHERVTLLNDVR